MIMMAACAVLGAVVGLYAKPRWLGVAIALVLVAAIEGGDRLFIGLIDEHGKWIAAPAARAEN